MSKKYKRDIFFNINEIQEKILSPFYVSCLFILGCLFFIIFILVKYYPVSQKAENCQSFFIRQISSAEVIILGFAIIIISLLFLLI